MSYLGPTPLPVPIGGSGASSLTNHGVVLGQGVSPVAVTSAGVAGQVLTSNGPAADPTFQAIATVTSSVSFFGYVTATIANATGDGTGVTIPYDAAVFGDASYFKVTAGAGQGLFTCPASGKYIFNAATYVNNLLSTHVEMHVLFEVNGASYDYSQAENPFVVSVPTGTRLCSTVILNLNAGDTVGARVFVAGGTKTVGIGGGTVTAGASFFCGSKLAESFAGIDWSDKGASTTVMDNSGSFATAAITLTLPVAPVVGTTCSFIVDHAGPLVVQASPGQSIRFGTVVSAVAGTATSSAYGDAIELVYRGTNSTWLATTAIGTWNVV